MQASQCLAPSHGYCLRRQHQYQALPRPLVAAIAMTTTKMVAVAAWVVAANEIGCAHFEAQAAADA